RADGHPGAAPEVLGVAGFTATLANEPAAVCADLLHRSIVAARERAADTERPWYSQAPWLAWCAVSLLVTEHYEELRPFLDSSIAEARALGDSSRLAAGLGLRGWLNLRLGDLVAAEN